jgi:hypothetical protein
MPFSSLGPTDPQTGMQGEAGLVLKDDRLLGPQGLEFFLTTDGTAWLLLSSPGGKNSWRASVDTLIGASSTGLDGPSV